MVGGDPPDVARKKIYRLGLNAIYHPRIIQNPILYNAKIHVAPGQENYPDYDNAAQEQS